MVQLPPAATLEPQLFDSEKSELLEPVMAMLVTASGVVAPMFIKLTDSVVLVVLTSCAVKVSVLGETLIWSPVPVSSTVCTLVPLLCNIQCSSPKTCCSR